MLAETPQTRDEAVHYWKTCRLSMNQRILLGSASQLASTPHIPESLAPARCYGIDVREEGPKDRLMMPLTLLSFEIRSFASSLRPQLIRYI
jgi:hypothetical protein